MGLIVRDPIYGSVYSLLFGPWNWYTLGKTRQFFCLFVTMKYCWWVLLWWVIYHVIVPDKDRQKPLKQGTFQEQAIVHYLYHDGFYFIATQLSTADREPTVPYRPRIQAQSKTPHHRQHLCTPFIWSLLNFNDGHL
jgi:hypothetical protein